ncbi:MAG: hypothetical protein NO515_03675 [Candidatus Methanomethylicia archaeon]|nr:hypothetical protein [Candidatus Methanomethylicia archaeon]
MEDDLVMLPKGLCRNIRRTKKGQMRILETIIAAAVVYIVFSAAFFLIRSSESMTLQETIDLNKLGYNTLHRLMESRTIEETLEKQQENGMGYLKNILQKFLPSGIYFNLTIYNCTGDLENPFESFSWSVSNAPSDEIANSKEIGHSSAIYTSKAGNIYFLVLNVARAGQG